MQRPVHRVRVADIITQACIRVEILMHVVLREPLYHHRLAALDCELLARGLNLWNVSILWMAKPHVDQEIQRTPPTGEVEM